MKLALAMPLPGEKADASLSKEGKRGWQAKQEGAEAEAESTTRLSAVARQYHEEEARSFTPLSGGLV
ncbi:hypothetical protein [Mesorhizobium sp. M0478]|uniref:hypothetical protein n=1 Tax=Mesorhizobium sp. M0478 TaxID=2956947 RepID=UPI0033365596